MAESVAERLTSAQAQRKIQEAVALRGEGRHGDAQNICRDILSTQPENFDALHLLGLIFYETGHPLRAVDLIGAALKINPNHAAALNNLGMAFASLGRHDFALNNYDLAVAIKPGFSSAHNNRGNALRELGRFDAALQSYDRAIALTPEYASAHSNRGSVLRDLKRLEAAVESCDRALKINGNLGEAHNNRGNALRDLGHYDAALASFETAVALMPGFAGAHANRGNVLRHLGRLDAAIESYDQALQLKPDFPFLYGIRLLTKMQICDWQGIDLQIADLVTRIERDDVCTPPFPTLAISSSLSIQRKAAEMWTHKMYPPNSELGDIPQRARAKKVRLGYFSMDFRDHPVSALVAELIETHDRDKFEVFAFSFGPDTKDEMRKRLEGAFDEFIDVRHQPDREIAEIARSMGVDIAIDLAGHTAESRSGVFALRAAPIQVNYLGYSGTMGATYIDYLIADKIVVPENLRHHYAEKVVYLPETYQTSDTTRSIADRVFSREELGLPAAGFVFCCFNSNYKILPQTLDIWARILRRVDGSVLWLRDEGTGAAANLRREAELRGVDGRRLVFAPRMTRAEHFARHRAADLFLDTHPYNAHATANDALWAGLPVLTCAGEAFASRVAASLLSALGLPEFVTSTQDDYEGRAVALALDRDRLGSVRERLALGRESATLFNIGRYTAQLEEAYALMMERYVAGLSPDHIAA